MEQVAPLTAHEIAKLTPFPATGSEIDLLSRRLFNPADYRSAATWATKVKESHRKLCGGFVTLATRARKKLKGRHIKRLSDFNEALEQLGQGPDSFLGSLIKSSVSHGGRRALELRDAADLHAAVVVNPYLRHYFYGLLYYVISISRLWRQQTLNRDPSATRDDWTDVGVCLYTGDDDVIVSKDSLVQQVFAAVNSKTRVIPADGV
jgi:hypothetical protein